MEECWALMGCVKERGRSAACGQESGCIFLLQMGYIHQLIVSLSGGYYPILQMKTEAEKEACKWFPSGKW